MMAFGSWGISYLRALHVQQRIRAEAPSQHQGKAGTPTMGGLLLVPSVVVATVLAAPQISWDLMVPLVAMLAYGTVGAIDDALALRFHRNLGLRARERLIVQFALAAAVAILVLRFTGAPDRVLPLVGAIPPGVSAVFMGDVGSNALGAALATIAIVTQTEGLLLIVGAIFVLEALSVLLQVAYFKATGRRRIFRMSPLH